MYAELLNDQRFFGLLRRVDEDLETQARAAGCRVCGHAVHGGNFPRKARGVPGGLEKDFEWRLSFCCARRECRTRLTPPSPRFLGRKVYVSAAVVILVSALRCGATRDARRGLQMAQVAATLVPVTFVVCHLIAAAFTNIGAPADLSGLGSVVIRQYVHAFATILRYVLPAIFAVAAAVAFTTCRW